MLATPSIPAGRIFEINWLVLAVQDAPVTHVEAGTTEQEEVKERLNIAEAGETKVKPGCALKL